MKNCFHFQLSLADIEEITERVVYVGMFYNKAELYFKIRLTARIFGVSLLIDIGGTKMDFVICSTFRVLHATQEDTLRLWFFRFIAGVT